MHGLLWFFSDNAEIAMQIADTAELTGKVPIGLATATTGMPGIERPASNDSSKSQLQAMSSQTSNNVAFA